MKISCQFFHRIIVPLALVLSALSLRLRADTFYVANYLGQTVSKYSSSGDFTGKFSAFYPKALTRDRSGNLYIVTARGEIFRYSSFGGGRKQLRMTGPASIPGPIACDPIGNFFVINKYDDTLCKFTSDGQYAGVVSYTGISSSTAMTSDSLGNIYVANVTAIRKFGPGGVDLGNLVSGIFQASALACNRNNVLYISIPGIGIRNYASGYTFPGSDIYAAGMAFDSRGDLYATNSGNSTIERYSANGNFLGVFANEGIYQPFGLSIGTSFDNQSGDFSGLFDDGTGALDVTLNSQGSFTGKVRKDGGDTLRIKGMLDNDGHFAGSFGGSSTSVTLQANFDSATSGGYYLTGLVETHAITAHHSSYRMKEDVGEAGGYTFLLKPGSSASGIPRGIGSGVVSVNNRGSARVAGKLGDGTVFSVASPLVGTSNGGTEHIVFNGGLYRKQGGISGRSVFSQSAISDASGTVTLKIPTSGGAINSVLSLIVARYTRPDSGQAALPFSTSTIQFGDGGLASPFSATSGFVGNTAAISGSNEQSIKLKVKPSDGSFSGSFIHPTTEKITKFGGFIYQHPGQRQAGGYFLSRVNGVITSGGVTILP